MSPVFAIIPMMPGPTEMVVIGIIAVLLFGNRLPSVARSCGKSLLSFKAGMKDIEKEMVVMEKEASEITESVQRASDAVSKAVT